MSQNRAWNQWFTIFHRALSEEGKSFSYDIKASGFGRGEGGGCFFLKRLDDAIRDGDPIHAVVRNSACSHVGRSEGITMPRNSAQANLLVRVHEEVNLNPSDTRVVEVCLLRCFFVFRHANTEIRVMDRVQELGMCALTVVGT